MEANSSARPPIIFGGYRSNFDFKRWMSGFDAEMHCYRRGPYGEKGTSLDILHISTDLKAASDEMATIAGFLESRGFSHECVPKPKQWSAADLLIVGSDELHSKYAVDMASNLPPVLGIVTPLDVLLYGLHGRIETGLAPVDRPLLAGKSFGVDGICLAHYRMRRWTDNIVLGGIFNAKVIGIENCIDAVMGWKDKWFTAKVRAFKEKVMADGHWDHEAELFFAAVELAYTCRNVGAHAQPHVPKNKSADYSKKKLQAFNEVAAKHGRYELYKTLVSNNAAGMTESIKHYIRLATYAHNWASEYARHYGRN